MPIKFPFFHTWMASMFLLLLVFFFFFFFLFFFNIGVLGARCIAIIARARTWRFACVHVFSARTDNRYGIRPKWNATVIERIQYEKAKPRTPKMKDQARVKADSQFMNSMQRSFKIPALTEITQWKKECLFLILFLVNLLSAFKTLSNVSKDCVIRGSVVSGHCSPLFSIHASYTSFSCDGPYVKKNRQVNNRIICLARWATFAKYKHRNTHTNAKIFHFGLRCRWG